MCVTIITEFSEQRIKNFLNTLSPLSAFRVKLRLFLCSEYRVCSVSKLNVLFAFSVVISFSQFITTLSLLYTKIGTEQKRHLKIKDANYRNGFKRGIRLAKGWKQLP